MHYDHRAGWGRVEGPAWNGMDNSARGGGVCTRPLVVLCSLVFVFSFFSKILRPLAPTLIISCRSARDIANKHTAQHSTAQSKEGRATVSAHK